MSRVAKNPVVLPQGVEAKFGAGVLTIKGSLGSLSVPLCDSVDIKLDENALVLPLRMKASLLAQCLVHCVHWSTIW